MLATNQVKGRSGQDETRGPRRLSVPFHIPKSWNTTASCDKEKRNRADGRRDVAGPRFDELSEEIVTRPTAVSLEAPHVTWPSWAR